MEPRGVAISVLRDLHHELKHWSGSARFLYNGQSGLRMGSYFHTRQLSLDGVIIRETIEINEEEWEAAEPIPITAAVGDRVDVYDKNVRGTVTSITSSKEEQSIQYTVTPILKEFAQSLHGACNHTPSLWDKTSAIIVTMVSRDLKMTTEDLCEEVVKPLTALEKESYLELLVRRGGRRASLVQKQKEGRPKLPAAISSDQPTEARRQSVATVSRSSSRRPRTARRRLSVDDLPTRPATAGSWKPRPKTPVFPLRPNTARRRKKSLVKQVQNQPMLPQQDTQRGSQFKPESVTSKSTSPPMSHSKYAVPPTPTVKNATKYVCHSYQYEFETFVTALEDSIDREMDYLWIDVICQNYHVRFERDTDFWEKGFMNHIQGIRSTLLVLPTWNDMRWQRRAWCLWEIHSTVHSKSKLQIAMPEKEKKCVLDNLQNNYENMVTTLFTGLDCRLFASTRNIRDQTCIRTAVFEKYGYETVNTACLNAFKQSVMEVAKSVAKFNIHAGDYRLMKKLALLTFEQKKFDQAEELYRRAVQEMEEAELLGSTHIFTIDTIGELCLVLHAQQKLDEAEALNRKVLKEQERTYGRSHSNTLETVHNLACVVRDQGKVPMWYEESELLFRRALEGRSEAFGRGHSKTIMTMSSLANILFEQEKLDEAESLYREAFRVREDIFGQRHPVTSDTATNLAILLHIRGKKDKDEAMSCFDEAELLLRNTLGFRESSFGSYDIATIRSINQLALLLQDHDKVNEALSLFSEGTRRCDMALAKTDQISLEVKRNFGNLLMLAKRHIDAEPLLKAALQGQERTLGSDHPETLNTMGILGNLFKDLGKYDDAEGLLKNALKGWEALLGPNHIDTLSAASNLATVLDYKRKFEESEKLKRRVLHAWIKTFGPKHNITFNSTGNLGSTLINIGQVRAGKKMVEGALDGLRSEPNPLSRDHPWIIKFEKVLSMVVQSDAVEHGCFKPASILMDKIMGKERSSLPSIMNSTVVNDIVGRALRTSISLLLVKRRTRDCKQQKQQYASADDAATSS